MADPPHSPQPGPPSTPRWVKVLGMITAVVVAAIVILALVGDGHGPGRHSPGGDGDTPPVQHNS